MSTRKMTFILDNGDRVTFTDDEPPARYWEHIVAVETHETMTREEAKRRYPQALRFL